VFTAADDGTARAWDTATGRELFTVSSGDSPVRHIAVSRDGSNWCLTTEDGEVAVYAWAASELVALAQARLPWTLSVVERARILRGELRRDSEAFRAVERPSDGNQ
jgi:hypothetical protein